MDEYTKAIARILKARQRELSARGRAVSYSELAETTGLSRPTVSRVLNGRRDISAKYLRALCDALDLSPGQVLDEADDLVA